MRLVLTDMLGYYSALVAVLPAWLRRQGAGHDSIGGGGYEDADRFVGLRVSGRDSCASMHISLTFLRVLRSKELPFQYTLGQIQGDSPPKHDSAPNPASESGDLAPARESGVRLHAAWHLQIRCGAIPQKHGCASETLPEVKWGRAVASPGCGGTSGDGLRRSGGAGECADG